tara:strand:+ start:13119 stop:13457 length:339 start_codon:yes stop_codon:yes gene_type:complete
MKEIPAYYSRFDFAQFMKELEERKLAIPHLEIKTLSLEELKDTLGEDKYSILEDEINHEYYTDNSFYYPHETIESIQNILKEINLKLINPQMLFRKKTHNIFIKGKEAYISQ